MKQSYGMLLSFSGYSRAAAEIWIFFSSFGWVVGHHVAFWISRVRVIHRYSSIL